MSTTPASAREHLASLGIDHAELSHSDAVTMSYALRGWHVIPSTPAQAPSWALPYSYGGPAARHI